MNAADKIDLIQASGAHKAPEKISQLLVCNQVFQLAVQHRQMMLALNSFHAIGMDDIEPNLRGPAIGEALRQSRIKHLRKTIYLNQPSWSLQHISYMNLDTPSTQQANNNANSPVMLVTGSAKRIGAAIVTAAHQQGYRVIIHCHQSKQEAEALAAQLNQARAASATVIIADLTLVNESNRLNDFVERIMSCFGRLDALIHNASRFYPSPFGSIDHTQWDELFLTNAKAPLLLSQALLPHLIKTQGCIISLFRYSCAG